MLGARGFCTSFESVGTALAMLKRPSWIGSNKLAVLGREGEGKTAVKEKVMTSYGATHDEVLGTFQSWISESGSVNSMTKEGVFSQMSHDDPAADHLWIRRWVSFCWEAVSKLRAADQQ